MDLLKTSILVVVLALPALAGCLGDDDGDDGMPDPSGTTSVFERNELPFNTSSTTHSWTLEAGQYDIISPGTQYFTSAGLEATEGVPAVIGDDLVSIGVHFPDIPGCDWGSDSLPPECNIPVIADVGPYYSATVGLPEAQLEGDAPVTEYTCGRLMCTLVDNFVPHGYAVAMVSVLGTGDSGHCMDLMGSAEQAGVQAAVEFLGTQAWSNGNVGLIGRSYDGSTPWEAAMVDSEHLKTIVPISGLMGQYDLMWRNGSAELRGPGVLYGLYAAMTIDGDASDAAQVLCPDYLLGGPEGVINYLAGSNAADPAYEYWSERYFYDDVVANYEGSIYYIHGMQDWNVDNHQAFPYYNQLLDEGFEMKGFFGQWQHEYPDRRSEHQNNPQDYGGTAYPQSVRYDWTQDLLEWFDHYLMETGPQPALHVEIQDTTGQWRVESEYPPRDAERVTVGFDTADSFAVSGTGANTQVPQVSQTHSVTLTFPALDQQNDTRIAGNIHLPVTVTPTGPGGQIGAELRDAETGLRLGHAVMDLRYHAGGNEMQAVAPGMPITAQMEFFALDTVLPAGHGLELALMGTVEDYLPSTTSEPVIVDLTDASSLRLPVVERDGSTFFTPPVWYDDEGDPLDEDTE